MVTIGIDLGTTYSCVATYKDGEVEVIQNDVGRNTTPSFVSYSEGDWVVGETAKQMAPDNPENTFHDVKRMIGKTLQDPFIHNYSKIWPFKLTEQQGLLKVVAGESKFSPEEISSKILSSLKLWAEEYLGEDEIRKAVVTVPAYFNEAQRELTAKACSQAGLDVLRLVPEPVAAAIAYNAQRPSDDPRNFLIFDLGGGTFDIAIVSSHRNKIQIKSINGDPNLGGEDIDNAMVNFCLKTFKQNHGVDLRKEQNLPGDRVAALKMTRNLRRIKVECEKTKCFLSCAENLSVDVAAVYNRIDLSVPFPREKLEELSEQLFQKCLMTIDFTLQMAGMRKEDIDNVVLVGGSSRIPRLQSLLVAYFGQPLTRDINPDEIVACGAAYLANSLAHPDGNAVVIEETFLKLQNTKVSSQLLKTAAGHGLQDQAAKLKRKPLKWLEISYPNHKNVMASEAAGDELVGTTTARQVMEKRANDIEPLESRVQNLVPPKAEQNKGTQTTQFAAKEFVASNMEEEYALVKSELRKIKGRETLRNGATLQGQTVAGILESNKWPKSTVKISNYMDVSLVDGKYFPDEGIVCDPNIMFVPGRTKEVFTLNQNNGQLSFRIGQSSISLYVQYDADSWVTVRVAFVPVEMSVNQVSWGNFRGNKHNYSLFRQDFKACKWDGHGGEFFIKLGNLRARAKLLPAANRKCLLSVDIGSVEEILAVTTSPDMKSIQALDTHFLTNSDANSKLDILTGDFAALIRISNRLDINLEDPVVYVGSGNLEQLPPLIEPSKHELLMINDSNATEGVVTFRISTTDLRLAIAFNIQPNINNRFAIEFVPSATQIGQDVLNSLFKKDFFSWSTRTDQRIASALNGPQTIYRRNIGVRAKMSNDPRALLDIVVAIF